VSRGGIPLQRTGLAAEMRAEFDSAFSRPPRQPGTGLEDMLALRLGAERCFVRLSDIAGVIANPLLTAVPTTAPALLGITSNHGSLVGAYDLAVLLGRVPTKPRWLVICAAEPSVGLTFEHFDGYQRVTGSLSESVLLVRMPAVVETIRALTRKSALPQNSQHVRAQNRSGD
jgi:chemotaxis signal transduction protein